MASRVGLDRAVVVQAAAKLVDGGAELTLADLAAHLGIRTPSLYNHIAGQEGLRRELALLGVSELGARLGRAAMGKAGEDAMVALAHAYRAFARARPGLYAATVRAPDPGDVALLAASNEVLAVLQAVLEPYGLRDEAAVHVMRGWRSLLHGFVTLEQAGGFGLPTDLDASFSYLVHVFISGLPRHHGKG